MENRMEVPRKTKSYPMIHQSHSWGDKTIIQKDTCSPMFIAALFVIVKSWKRPNRPLIEEWIRKMYTHRQLGIGILLSHKKEQSNAFCSSMDRPRDYRSKWSERKTNTV